MADAIRHAAVDRNRADVQPDIHVDAFLAAYRQAVEDLAPFFTPERQAVIARHDPSLSPGRYDLHRYLRASEIRYETAIRMFLSSDRCEDAGMEVIEVGGFLGAYPLALARLGVSVTMVEAFHYYEGAFDDLRDLLAREGVNVWDTDLTEPLDSPPERRYDLVTNMAMVEHLPHSPRPLLDNLRSLMAKGGRLILEVPNIAYWPKRMAALRGRSVHPALRDVYEAEVPFIGHHREYTAAELHDLLDWTGLELIELEAYNYSWDFQGTAFQRLLAWLQYRWPTLLFPSCREILMASARLRP